MTILEFRRELANQWASELKNNKLLDLMLEAVATDHPANHALTGDISEDISPTRAAIELGVTKGYSMLLGRIRICGRPLATQEGMPESEYAEEEKQEEAKTE